MKTYINRQAVFNSKNEVVAYELLVKDYSDYDHNLEVEKDFTQVLKKVLVDFDINMLAGGKRLFISFTPELIANGAVKLLNPQNIIVKIRYNRFDADKLALLKGYKNEGYIVAVDCDSIDVDDFDAELVDIIVCKNDGKIINKYKHLNKVMLIKSIDSNEQFIEAEDLDFTMFSGLFFQEPIILEHDALVFISSVYIELLEEINKKEIDLEAIAVIIMHDTNLTFSFLRLVNSVAYFANNKITSVKAALVRLGEKEMNKLLLVNMLKNIACSGSSNEVVRLSLRRGKQAELLAKHFTLGNRSHELFLLGMFSLINVIMRQPMKKILMQVPLAEDINIALLGQKNALSQVLELILYHERDLTTLFNKSLACNGISFEVYNGTYIEALKWVDDIYKS